MGLCLKLVPVLLILLSCSGETKITGAAGFIGNAINVNGKPLFVSFQENGPRKFAIVEAELDI